MEDSTYTEKDLNVVERELSVAEYGSSLKGLVGLLEKIGKRFPDHGKPDVEATDPSPRGIEERPIATPTTARRRIKRTNSPPRHDRTPVKYGSTKAAKPPKLKYRADKEPAVYYDGEAQNCLYNCWTTLNVLQGALRKEMRNLQRRQVFTSPVVNTDHTGGISGDDLDHEITVDDEDSDNSCNYTRLQDLFRHGSEEEEKKLKVLEYVNSRLGETASACEAGATVWLNGRGSWGHIMFMTKKLKDAMESIEAGEIRGENVKEGDRLNNARDHYSSYRSRIRSRMAGFVYPPVEEKREPTVPCDSSDNSQRPLKKSRQLSPDAPPT